MASIRRRDSGNWKATIRRPALGVPRMDKTFRLREDAVAWARKIESEIERGVWRDMGAAEMMPLGHALTRYAEEVSATHEGKEIERYTIGVISDEPLCKRPLSTISTSDIRALRDVWLSRGYAAGTINRRVGLIGAVFEEARGAWGMSALENPTRARGLKLKEKNRERRVSVAEIDAICAATASPRLASVIRLAVETGMRRGELAKLEWCMLDLAAGVVAMPGWKLDGGRMTKNGNARGVPLSSAATEVLKQLPRKEKLVFAGYKPHSVSQAWSRAREKARRTYVAERDTAGQPVVPDFLMDLHFHDLRHEACSRLAEIFDMHVLMKIVGHSSPRMLMRYYHPDTADLAKKLRAQA